MNIANQKTKQMKTPLEMKCNRFTDYIVLAPIWMSASICLSVCLPVSVYLSVRLPFRPFMSPSVCLSIRLAGRLSV